MKNRDIVDALIVIVAATLALLVLAGLAHARWNPLTSGISAEQVSQYHDWFLAQRQEDHGGPCCGDEYSVGGDGHYVDVDVRTDGYYVFVRELGGWQKFEGPVNPDHENPTGRNVAWYVIMGSGKDQRISWFCLRLAIGT